jgi:putative PEP-CTERM system histidine kinase
VAEAFPTIPAIWAYGIAAIIFSTFALQLLLSWKGGLRASVLLCASITSAAWSLCVAAALAYSVPTLWSAARAIDAIRLGTWLLFLLLLVGSRGSKPKLIGITEISRPLSALALFLVAAALLPYSAPWQAPEVRADSPVAFYGMLGISILGLALCEQLYRRTPADRQWAIKPLVIGLTGMFALDVLLFSSAALFKNLEPALWAARGLAHASVIFFVAVATARNASWTINLYISRDMVFHSTAMLGAGIYLIVVAGAGYWVHFFGGEWGATLKVTFIFVALLALGALMLSGSLRSRLRVFINKNLFSHRYDYRREWLQFTRQLGTSQPGETLNQQVIRSLAGLVESSGGAIWLGQKNARVNTSNVGGSYTEIASLNLPGVSEAEPATSEFITFLARTGWVVELDELRTSPDKYPGLALPQWLASLKGAWLVIPLMNVNDLVGFVILARPRTTVDVNWEVLDLLKTASRQAASYLVLFRTKEALVETEQFDAFNRMSAFVVHDLKNLIAQLALLLKNAERHRDNPEFQADMLDTIAHVVKRMNHLMLQLGSGTTPIEKPRSVELTTLVQNIVQAKAIHNRLVKFDDTEQIRALAHEERVERVIGHIVQNAIEASAPDSGVVFIRVFRRENSAVLEVRDEGCGMSEDFVRRQLFHPFQTTKRQGMGIGMYESFEYINSVGGSISVESKPGVGTSFSVLLPLADSTNHAESFPRSLQ